MARVVGDTGSGKIVAKLTPRPHPDTCWCRPAQVSLAAQKKG